MVGEVGTEDQGASNMGEIGERKDSDMVCQRERTRADGGSRNGGREWHGGRD